MLSQKPYQSEKFSIINYVLALTRWQLILENGYHCVLSILI